MSRTELLSKIATLTGGRAAKRLIFGADNMTTGASNDIEQATQAGPVRDHPVRHDRRV